MAELNARIIAKASGTASEEPLAADLEVAELAVNTADGKLFTKHTDGSIVTISGGGGGGGLGLTGTSLEVEGNYNFSSLLVGIPSNAAVGDLAVIAGSVRAGGNPNSIVPIAVPSGWTLARSQGYTSTSSTSANILSFVLHKELDASDISAGSVSLSLTTPSTDDDWHLQIASFSDATLGAVTIVDTTLAGQLPAEGYDFTGPAAPADGFAFSVVTSVFAYSPQGGVQMTPLSGADVAWLNPAADGSGYEEGVVRRISSFLGTGINSFNLGALNDSGVATELTDGYHIISVSIIPKLSGGGGAVDSVNGETGTVSLGIQEMDDFELNPGNPWEYDFLWDTKLESGDSNLPGEWATNSVRWAATDSEGTTYSATGTQQFWLSPDNATWTEVNGDVVHYTADSNDYYYIGSPNTALTNQINNEGWVNLYLTFTDPTNNSLTETPLEEGDILQWNNVDQKFKPAQLAAASVNSVNGETGVVSLGIQDMDDFELAEGDGSAGVTIYHFEDAPDWSSGIDAQQWTGNSIGTLYTRSPDLNGANFNPAVADHDLSQGVYVSTDGSNFTHIPSVVAAYSNAANDSLIGLRTDDWGPLQPQFIAENASTDLYIALEQPNEIPLIPLAEGDILQWNNADQKFKPAQAKERIQDMDDFDFNYSGEPSFSDLQRSGTWSNWMDAHSDPPGYQFPDSQGEWRAYKDTPAAEGGIQVASLDDDGNSAEDWVNVNVTGLLMLLTVDGQTYGPIPVKAITDSVSYGFYLNWDISDLDPSLYSWGYEIGNPAQLPTSPRPIKPFTIQLGYTFSVQPSIPLAEGDILQWDDVSQKFKPAQAKERIQDMDDFDLNIQTSDQVFTNKVGNNNLVNNVQDWSIAGANFFYSSDLSSVMAQLEIGDLVTISASGVSDYSGTLSGVDSAASSGVNYISFGIGDTSDWVNLPDGSPVTVSSAGFAGGTDIDLAEGDILKWNDSDQKFKPAQLPAGGGGAVDSVNGENGVVSLGIQDMDDFQLNEATGIYRWDDLSTSNTLQPGEFGRSNFGTNYFTKISSTDSEGNDVLGFFSSLTYPATIWRKQGTGGWSSWTVDSYSGSSTITLSAFISATAPLYISATDPGTGVIPLADGDVLQWSIGEQKFKPDQVIDKATLQAEVAASADFADFQARIAAL